MLASPPRSAPADGLESQLGAFIGLTGLQSGDAQNKVCICLYICCLERIEKTG